MTRWTIRADRTGQSMDGDGDGSDGDGEFLAAMIYEASFNPNRPRPLLDEALRLPWVRAWLDGWRRAGDGGVIALDGDGRRAGGAWYRLFTGIEAGPPGFIDAATPAIAIATVPTLRGQGVGGALLDALLDRARGEGFVALSLSVGRSNPALRLYERHGFTRFEDDGVAPLRMRRAL